MNLISLEKEIIITEQKIEEYKEKVKALKQRKLNEENAQIIKMARSANMSIAELCEMFQPKKPVPNKEDDINV